MLKKASLLLPLILSFWICDVMGQLQTDTINKINIKIIVKEKPETLINTPNLHKKRPKRKTTQKVNTLDPVIKVRSKKQTDTIDSSPKNYVKKQLSDSLIKIIPAKSKLPTTEKQLKAKKNIHFLISLLLIVTGTLLAVFYRSGIPLIVAILLLVTGYYILIYTLVFMG